MRFFIVIILSVFLFSCNQPEKIKPVFVYIDFTYFDGHYGKYSLRLDSNAYLYMSKINLSGDSTTHHYRGFIDTSNFRRINSEIAKLYNRELKTEKPEEYWPRAQFNLIVKGINRDISYRIYYMPNINNSLSPLFKELGSKSLEKNLELIDSSFNFLSNDIEEQIPPPPHPSLNYK